MEAATEGLRMLADPTRFRLLWLLCGAELDVTTLAERLGIARPSVSQHLAKLRLVGLVTQRRDGRRQVYRARDTHVGRLLSEAVRDADHRGTADAPDAHHAHHARHP
ncbi:metalloregulator ArsR/SmtB family transcription factor [Actinomycetospora lutea]|uniref:ArsR/SmtB family transcription factor n=1 Tax=Actinomycetospora lutea TaxID=663604 RepID=UPI0030823B7E